MWGVHVCNRVFFHYLRHSEVGRGGDWFDSFPVVFGSTKISVAAVNRNLEQGCSSHQFHLCPPNTWPQLMFKVQVVMLCYHWGWTGFQKGLCSGSQTSQVECECHHAFLHHLECGMPQLWIVNCHLSWYALLCRSLEVKTDEQERQWGWM